MIPLIGRSDAPQYYTRPVRTSHEGQHIETFLIYIHLQNLHRLCRYSSVWTYYGYKVQSPQIQSIPWSSEILPVQPVTFSVYTKSIRNSYLQQSMLLYVPEFIHLVTMFSESVSQTIQICSRIHLSAEDVLKLFFRTIQIHFQNSSIWKWCPWNLLIRPLRFIFLQLFATVRTKLKILVQYTLKHSGCYTMQHAHDTWFIVSNLSVHHGIVRSFHD
jgi:hypothetical protein